MDSAPTGITFISAFSADIEWAAISVIPWIYSLVGMVLNQFIASPLEVLYCLISGSYKKKGLSPFYFYVFAF